MCVNDHIEVGTPVRTDVMTRKGKEETRKKGLCFFVGLGFCPSLFTPEGAKKYI
jgi:hypothetical protein